MKHCWSPLVAAVLLLAGCGEASRSSREVKSNAGTYVVAYTPTPDPVPMNQLFDLAFTLKSTKTGAPPSPAPAVEVDARMPAHGHGMNRVPKLSKLADGSYKVEGMLFHMPGHWEFYVDIAAGGVTERAQFDIDLK